LGVGALVQRVQDAGRQLLLRLWQGALQLALLMLLLTLLLWVAAFLYGSFYYSYMPTPSYSAPVHFFYRCVRCDSAICSFPRANISLLQDGQKQVMTYGQPYRISLHLDMPESPANQNLGMFMVKMSCYSHGGKVISTSARSTCCITASSSLLQSVGTLLFSPLLLTGVTEQKQVVTIELFSAYRENAYLPTVGVVVELQSQRVQIYSAVLLVHAHFTGIRYVLYQFPGLSALLGVASNFGFLSLLILLSSAQFSWRRFVSAPVHTHTHTHLYGLTEMESISGDENVPDAQSTDEQGTGSAGQGSEVETTSSVSEETPCDVNVEETDAAVFCSSPPRPEEVNCIIS
uniref:Seipin n=1 Tax=Denticeps clupeoides TaxID=299321 RepID=A0AAY4BTD6_9TELE